MNSIKEIYKYRVFKIYGILTGCILLLLSCSSKSDTTPEGGGNGGGNTPPAGVEQSFKRKVEVANYVEYRTGNAPLIISVPHDGASTDAALVQRTKDNCPDPSFSTARDVYTTDLANLIDSIYTAKTGKYAYMVIGRISRKYVDFNREQKYAVVAGSTKGVSIYNTYHNRAAAASDSISKKFGAGLLLDIHGHSHDIQQIELGYLLKSSILNLSNAELGANADYLNKCSIYNLVKNNKSNSNFIDLLRGANSFGSIIYKNGLACIPHSGNLSPGSSSYFSSGEITERHGSSNGTGVVDAIQCEFNRNAREEANRKKTAEAIVLSVIEYMDKHYKLK